MNIYSLLIYFGSFSLTCFFGIMFEKYIVDKYNLNFIKKIIFSLLIFFPLIWISGNRIGVGTDYWSYYNLVNTYGKLNISQYLVFFQGKEIAFYVICRVVFLLGNINLIYYFMPAIMSYFVFDFYLFNKSNINFMMVLIIFCTFFFPKSLNISRQMISVSIVLYACCFLNRNIFKFIIYILLATLFHITSLLALIIVPVYYIFKVRGLKYRAILLLLYIVFFLLFFIIFRNIFVQIFIDNSNIRTQSDGYKLQIVLQLVPLFFSIILKLLLDIKEKMYNIYLVILLFSFFLFVLFNKYPWGFRLTYYFATSVLYLIPYGVNKIKKERFIVYIFIISFYIFQFILLYVFLGYDQIFPFYFK